MSEGFSINITLVKKKQGDFESIEKYLKNYKREIYTIKNSLAVMGNGTYDLKQRLETKAKMLQEEAETIHNLKETLEDILRLYEFSEAKLSGDNLQELSLIGDKVLDIITDGIDVIGDYIDGWRDKKNQENMIDNIADKETRDGFSGKYQETLVKIYEDVPPEYSDAKKLYDKHIKNLKVDTFETKDENGTPNPRESRGVLYLNEDRDLNNLRGNGTTFYHEYGHYVVTQEGWIKEKEATGAFKDFENSLRKEVNQYIENYENKYREEGISKNYSGEQLETYIADNTRAEIKKDILGPNNEYSNINNGISDIIDGVSNDKYQPNYGHPDGYWNIDQSRVPNEAFAQIFSAQMTGDEIELAKIKEIMPETYEIYMQMISDATK